MIGATGLVTLTGPPMEDDRRSISEKGKKTRQKSRPPEKEGRMAWWKPTPGEVRVSCLRKGKKIRNLAGDTSPFLFCFRFSVFIVLVFDLLAPSSCFSLPARKTSPRLVIFVLDRVTLPDILKARAPTLHSLLREGAIGLMNTASTPPTPSGAYLTLSSGVHSAGVGSGGECLNANEPFEEDTARWVFFRRTGHLVSPQALVCLGIVEIQRANQERRTGATPGLLGDWLSTMGKTACMGSPQVPGEPPGRLSPLLIMRSSGVIDLGDVSDRLLTPHPLVPYGVQTDPVRLEDLFQKIASEATFLVVDLGETSRAEAYRIYLSRTSAQWHRLKAIERADYLLKRLLQHIDPHRTLIVVLCPQPARSLDTEQIDSLAPFILWGRGSGLLTSATTQRLGVVANIDFLPTLVHFLHLGPPPRARQALITGSSMEVLSHSAPLEYLRRLDQAIRIGRQASTSPLLLILALLIGFFVALVSLGLFLPFPSQRLLRLARSGLATSATFPALLILVPAFSPSSLPEYSQKLIGMGILLWGLYFLFPSWALGIASGLTLALLVGSLLFFPEPLYLSVLSDFSLVGVRFHGLGNEYSALGLASYLVLWMLLERRLTSEPLRKEGLSFNSWLGRVYLLLGGFFLFVIGYPKLGDNWGGVITGMTALGLFWWFRTGRPLGLRPLCLFVLLGLGIGTGFIFLDFYQGSPTHLGALLQRVHLMGGGYLLTLASRKLFLNWRLMTDPRAIAFYIALGVLAILWGKPLQRALKETLQESPLLESLLKSLVGASVPALIFNDTGIVFAGLLLTSSIIVLADHLVARRSVR